MPDDKLESLEYSNKLVTQNHIVRHAGNNPEEISTQ